MTDTGTSKRTSLGVYGSRTLKDERVKIILMEEIEKYGVTEMVTAAAPGGVCEVARDLCKEKAIPLTLYFLDFQFRRGAFEHRSIASLKGAERAVFIHDGVSRGTANELKLARKMGIPYSLYTMKPTKHNSVMGFEIEEEWSEAHFEPLTFEGIGGGDGK